MRRLAIVLTILCGGCSDAATTGPTCIAAGDTLGRIVAYRADGGRDTTWLLANRGSCPPRSTGND